MIKNIQATILLIILSFAFIKNSYAEDAHHAQNEGINDARKSESPIHQEYLQCYALNEQDKANCHKKIINDKKLFNQKQLSSSLYLTSFYYEAERLGFLWFLHENHLSCDAISEGPLYQTDKNAYEVVCKNGNKYFMQFDYDKSLWHCYK